jgi:23S rRNA (adenine-N6)-dimethyltransferase
VAHRSARDRRRRSLGQNFLCDKRVVGELASLCAPDELVVEFGAGAGALTIPLALNGAQVLAIERDPAWARMLRQRLTALGVSERVTIVEGDLLRIRLPDSPYRVIASPPFNLTTAILKALLDRPDRGPTRADLVVQWHVARKRSAVPPTTLISTRWAPWWRFETIRRIPRNSFRPVPRVDAAWLAISKRNAPLLPPRMAKAYAEFVRAHWY